jgi:hypothetical protein
MSSNHQKSIATETPWGHLHQKHLMTEEAAEEPETQPNNAATIRIVIVLVLLIIATALFGFLSLYRRVSI